MVSSTELKVTALLAKRADSSFSPPCIYIS
jgi:hypothetical protein